MDLSPGASRSTRATDRVLQAAGWGGGLLPCLPACTLHLGALEE